MGLLRGGRRKRGDGRGREEEGEMRGGPGPPNILA